ncbi:MAG: methyltransferase domain-containing protein [Planctomycetota bacterium]|nr:MAG: methyltransferase domain-containing protein [Planctomycetota bacterium]
MTSQKLKSARTIAAIVLNRFDPKYDYAGPILSEMLHQTDEKQRATDLVYGSIRNRPAIDMVIAKLADCPTDRIQSTVLNTIRIGAYELIYCPQAPEYSIINEAVENAKIVAGEKRAGFVNAVLRQIDRHIKNRQSPLSETTTERTLPQTTTTGCEFDTEILQKPQVSPVDYFSSAFSLPRWLISDWLAEFGEEQVRQICFASNRRPGIYIRANTLKTTTQLLAEKLSQTNIDLEIVDGSMLKIKAPQAVTELPGFTEGLFSIQDISAAQPVQLLQPKPDWTILDLCAAPGTKTTQLTEATGDKAKIIATDIDSERLKKVKENIIRLGLNSVGIIEYENLQDAAAEIGLFDCILLDVPCSNTGVLSKRPEARYRISNDAIQKLTKTQTELLESAIKLLKPKGGICYSTCSIQKCENSELVKNFLQKNASFELKSERLFLPSAHKFDCDGCYVAIITKT